MRIATIDIVWSPPDPRWDNIGFRPPDRGGHLYRIYNHDNGNRIHMSGTNGRGPNFDGALRRAIKVARDKGYTHYVFMDAPGYPWPLD
jgi:hypothetical protein